MTFDQMPLRRFDDDRATELLAVVDEELRAALQRCSGRLAGENGKIMHMSGFLLPMLINVAQAMALASPPATIAALQGMIAHLTARDEAERETAADALSGVSLEFARAVQAILTKTAGRA